MKIALIHARVSNNNVPPLGLVCIAGFLKKKGIEVRIWDPCLHDEDFINEIKIFNPDLVGISLMTAQYSRAREIIYLLKKELPLAIYICGGSHVSALPGESLIGLNADIAVVGEGELTMEELCQRYIKGRDWQGVRGISYMQDGKIYHNKRRELIDDLDVIPFAGRELLNDSLDWYLIPPGVIRGKFSFYTTTMMTSRGCPYNCIFCASNVIFGRRFRRRSVENTIKEIIHLQKSYGIRGIWFLDDTFTFDRAWVEKFCETLKKEKLGITWSCQTRADALDVELLRQMKSAGCVQLEIGVESGSDKVLKTLSKGAYVDDLKEKFIQIKHLGFRVMANFMVGSPGEDIDDIMATYHLAKELNPDFTEFNVCMPYPGSRLYEMAKEKKWLINDRDSFGCDWSEHFTRSPVMHVNIEPQYLMKMRAKLQNRFLCRNYAGIIKGFLCSPVYLFLLTRSFFSYLKGNHKDLRRFLREGKLDTIVWDFYAHYSKMARSRIRNKTVFS